MLPGWSGLPRPGLTWCRTTRSARTSTVRSAALAVSCASRPGPIP